DPVALLDPFGLQRESPGGRIVPGTRTHQQNCAGASCSRASWISWPSLGIPCGTKRWERAKAFIPTGCKEVDCDKTDSSNSECLCGGCQGGIDTLSQPVPDVIPVPAESLELIVFLYRWPVQGIPPFDPVYQCDFHMIGRNPCDGPMSWHSKMDRRERVEDITDPEQSLADAYPHTQGNPRVGCGKYEIVKICLCCVPHRMEFAPDPRYPRNPRNPRFEEFK